MLIRVGLLALMVLVNGSKFGFMVRGMASLGATRFVAIDLVAGTVTEAVADTLLFRHAPTPRWFAGAAIMTAGVWLIAQAKEKALPLEPPPPARPPLQAPATRSSSRGRKAKHE